MKGQFAMDRRHFSMLGMSTAVAALSRPGLGQTAQPPSPENLQKSLPSPTSGPAGCSELPELPTPPSDAVMQHMFPGFKSQFLNTTGATIRVLTKGNGPPLLLLHGHPETHVTWHKVAPALAEQYSIFLPDLRCYCCKGTVHALCEDYRAAAGIDLDQDRADDAAGHKIKAPVHALWGAEGTVGQLWDVIATWKPKAAGPVTGKALPCGHLLPEEQPEEVLAELRTFFGA